MKIIALCVPLVLTGCHHVGMQGQLQYAYAKPAGLGMFDPKATTAGTVYLWNTKTYRLTALGELDLTAGKQSAPRTLESSRLAGLGVSGLPIEKIKLVDAQIGGKIRTTVTDSVRQPYYGTKTALKNFVITRKEQGASAQDIVDDFRAKDPDYRIVVFTSEEKSRKAEFVVSGTAGDEKVLSLKVALPNKELLDVTAKGKSTESCGQPDQTGDRPVCFTDVTVFDPYIQENGLMGWRIDDAYDQASLSHSLREQ